MAGFRAGENITAIDAITARALSNDPPQHPLSNGIRALDPEPVHDPVRVGVVGGHLGDGEHVGVLEADRA